MSDNVAAEQLRQFIERAERVMEEIANAREDLKAVFAEAKGTGFDTKTMKSIIKLRAMTPDARREQEALLDTYRAALGMLDGTPLGHWALERLKPKKPESTGKAADEDAAEEPAAAEGQSLPQAGTPAAPTVADAHHLGGEAAAAGAPVTSNPFPAFDERRAAWDEAWCAALGSDGMEIPDALKPASKPKKEPAHEPA